MGECVRVCVCVLVFKPNEDIYKKTQLQYEAPKTTRTSLFKKENLWTWFKTKEEGWTLDQV